MVHLERRHAIILAGTIDRVFALFTPIGERQWAPEWDPEFVWPENGETCDSMVFTTRHDAELTLWACIEWNPAAHRVRYARVTPASRFVLLDIACRALPDGRTEATVGYAATALTPAGEATLANLSEPGFADMIEGWRARIDTWLLDTAPTD